MNAPLNPPATPVAKALRYVENNFAGEHQGHIAAIRST
jgi:hypothetical protein